MELFANNATSTLATGINTSVTSLDVGSGHGARFPVITGSDYFYATLKEAGVIEIVKVTARSTDTFTIVRAQQGTAAASFTTAAVVEHRLTKASLETLRDAGVVQVVNTQTGAVATGTTILPADDTIPQNTEGDEYMTLAITPRSSTNKLKIDVVFHGTFSVSVVNLAVALFQDTTASAIALGNQVVDAAGRMQNCKFTHYMTAGTTSETTFKVRAGANSAGTTTFNGSAGARFYGGVFASSITITEIVP